MNPKTDSPAKKPRLALLIATGLGLGYLPVAPGTWGSLGGVAIYWALRRFIGDSRHSADVVIGGVYFVIASLHLVLVVGLALLLLLTILGIVFAGHVAKYLGEKDPQFVVIDEVCGQLLTYLAVLAPPNWKYLLLGFILFRGFDTWKPFPARQAESLPGGWGIMADDWAAGVYAAIGLEVARYLGL